MNIDKEDLNKIELRLNEFIREFDSSVTKVKTIIDEREHRHLLQYSQFQSHLDKARDEMERARKEIHILSTDLKVIKAKMLTFGSVAGGAVVIIWELLKKIWIK